MTTETKIRYKKKIFSIQKTFMYSRRVTSLKKLWQFPFVSNFHFFALFCSTLTKFESSFFFACNVSFLSFQHLTNAHSVQQNDITGRGDNLEYLKVPTFPGKRIIMQVIVQIVTSKY